jgi:hypothetical protein
VQRGFQCLQKTIKRDKRLSAILGQLAKRDSRYLDQEHCQQKDAALGSITGNHILFPGVCGAVVRVLYF